VTLIVGLTVLLVGVVWLREEYSRFARESEVLRRTYLEGQKALVRNEVEKALDYVQYRHARSETSLRASLKSRVYEAHAIATRLVEAEGGRRSPAELEHLVKEALRPIRFNSGRGYYFMVSLQGVEMLYPVAPQLEGTNLLGLKDAKGRFVIRDEIELLRKQSEGFIFDHWRKPGSSDQMTHPKLTFIKRFEPFNAYIGTGEYLDDFEHDLQEELLERISEIRFGREGYVFVNTYDGIPLITDGRRVVNPKNLWELTDPNGVKVMQEERKACEKPEGDFIYYTWNKLSQAVPSPKTSFIKGYPKWQWMVGAGVYIDDVEKIISERRAELRSSVNRRILGMFGVLVGLGFMAALAASLLSRWTRREFAVFGDFFDQAATQAATIDVSKLRFEEFATLASSANAMVESRVQAEAQNRLLQEDLLRMRKMEALGLLAGGVAHDLNNILAGLVLYPDLLLAELPEDSPLRPQLQHIKEGGQRAAAVVADLLAASRGGRREAQVLSLNAEVDRFLRSPEHRRQRDLHPRLVVRATTDPSVLNVLCSQAQLGKALMNLVANAMDAITGEGEVVISTANRQMEEPWIGFETIPPGTYAVLSVQDSGAGIPLEDQGRIFEPFFTKKILGRAGTGLGLTVVWHTVKDSGGFLHLESSSSGTTFELFFPATVELVPDPTAASGLTELKGKGQRILVVDDDPVQRDMLGVLLDRLGYQVTTAASGEEAIRLAAEEAFDLIILDMILEPGMGGRETFEAIREHRPEQRAIIASGYAETEDIRRTLELGAREAVLKPYTLERIGRAIQDALSDSS
jgi:signal transduction histidine kinase/ActR/RegA family two-component response regulator